MSDTINPIPKELRLNTKRNFRGLYSTYPDMKPPPRYDENYVDLNKMEPERDKRILEVLELEDEYDFVRIFLRMESDGYTLFDLVRVLLEGYIIRDPNIERFLVESKSNGKNGAEPKSYRKNNLKDLEKEEELRKMFQSEYLSREEQDEMFDFLDLEDK